MTFVMNEISAAELLGVQPGASPAEVTAAYRRYARRHHPDMGGDAADLDRAARARAVLLADPISRSTRTRTYHRRPPWWHRLIFWRRPS
jgi:hypothetical protein